MPFTCVPKQGYFLEIADADALLRYEHFLGGENTLTGASCLPCKRPLLLMAALDTRDPRLGIKFSRGRTLRSYTPKVKDQPHYHLPLLYCWSCGPRLHYRLNPVSGVDVLNHTPDAPGPGSFPYEPYPRRFPGRWVRLNPIPPKVQNLIRRANGGKLKDKFNLREGDGQYLRPRHQVGGQAYLMQRMHLNGGVACTLCGKESPFIASIADETGGKKTFYGQPYLQTIFHYCMPCQVVTAHHECD